MFSEESLSPLCPGTWLFADWRLELLKAMRAIRAGVTTTSAAAEDHVFRVAQFDHLRRFVLHGLPPPFF
jgi:hypothetical protein